MATETAARGVLEYHDLRCFSNGGRGTARRTEDADALSHGTDSGSSSDWVARADAAAPAAAAAVCRKLRNIVQ